jgi:hypothetical protein
MNKEQNKLVRNVCLLLLLGFLIAGFEHKSLLLGFFIPAALILILLYLKKSSVQIKHQTIDGSYDIKKLINAKADDLILGAALLTMNQLAYDSANGIGSYEEEEKDKLIYDVLVDIEKKLFAEDKVNAVRLRLIDLMFACAEMNVLIMKHPTMHKFLSGELEDKVLDLFYADDSFQKIFVDELSKPVTFEDLKNEITNRYLVHHFYMSAYNTVRVILKDYDDDLKNDWFRPCFLSFCIWQEDRFRSKLGLPLMVDNPLKTIAFSGWSSVVKENPIDLRKSFEQKWMNCFDEPSPFFEIEV